VEKAGTQSRRKRTRDATTATGRSANSPRISLNAYGRSRIESNQSAPRHAAWALGMEAIQQAIIEVRP